MGAGGAEWPELEAGLAEGADGSFFERLRETPAIASLLARVEAGGVLSLCGAAAASQPFLAALMHRLAGRPVVVVVDTLRTQERFLQDVETWMRLAQGVGWSHALGEGTATGAGTGTGTGGFRPPLFYPEWDILPRDGKLPHVDVISDRLETLEVLAAASDRAVGTVQAEPPLIVTTVVALHQRTLAREAFARRRRVLVAGDRIEPLDLVEWLEEQGYEPEAQVTQKGELALRGGILDVFPPTALWPLRLEFFGDELESIREFDPGTQISRNPAERAVLLPAGELGLMRRAAEAGGQQGGVASDWVSWLPAGTVLMCCEPGLLRERWEKHALEAGTADGFLVGTEELGRRLEERGVQVVELREGAESVGETDEPGIGDARCAVGGLVAAPDRDARVPEVLDLAVASLDLFRTVSERPAEPQVAETQRRGFFEQVHRWLRQGRCVRLFCNAPGELQRFREIWKEYGLEAIESPRSTGAAGGASGDGVGGVNEVARGALLPFVGGLSRGFLWEEAGLVVVTDAEVFGRYKVTRPRRLRGRHAAAMRSALEVDFADLEPGDYVVHLQHGIGRYLGMQFLPAAAGRRVDARSTGDTVEEQECLVIEYAAGEDGQEAPKLYVPVSEAHLVSKYIGAGKARPPLNTLGGTRWLKTKAQAERAVKDLAAELLRIQAARESQAGFACPADTSWQIEFESAFPYEETPDQLTAIQAAKRDQERPKAMDRLVCGDVGFGKTEVAIRCAFKAVMAGKQVAVLVPTTVLAQQHFNTFRERMADYPVRVEHLSRFRSRKEQTRVIEEVAAGAVDIVIGTHRLVQEDVVFKDLGLVVIDEEQRFGVMHKERFKALRQMVDVLTLSATPIPRTLYLAMAGARDLSTIQTPPVDRLPVETIVTQYDERLIRDAIRRELNRGGQVYFLHNRVSTIDAMAAKLAALVPDARLLVGHGQMSSDELERVMTQFVNGEADVLLSTTIIESGLDIPNANTILIDRADRFGLSDLYQLRGRVGRYKHQAYAYLLIPRHAGLLADARKRIGALKQYSSLGSGFKIAMRDLEIRGAGNLLGPEQSGHITAVGFDLYCQLLKQSVSALKGEKVRRRVDVQVVLDFINLHGAGAVVEAGGRAGAAATLPVAYVRDARQRIDVYRRLAQITEAAEIDALRRELADRYGPVPAALERLLRIADLKRLAAERGINRIEVEEGKVKLTRNGELITVDGYFPRLKKVAPDARLKELREILARGGC